MELDARQHRPALRPERVVVINDVSIARGGATGMALASIALLANAGIRVTFIAGDDGPAGPPAGASEFVPVHGTHILQAPKIRGAIDGLFNRAAYRRVAAWIEEHDTPRTVYHLHGWSKILSPSVFRALSPVAHRLLHSAHDFFLMCPNGGYFDFRRALPCNCRPMGATCLATACDRRSYPQKLWRVARLSIQKQLRNLGADGSLVAVVHDSMAPHFTRAGVPARAIRVLRNPIQPWRVERVPAESNRVFVYVGRLEEDKGIMKLAEAASRAGVTLHLIGAGVLGERLAAQYPGIVRWGWKTHAEIGPLIAGARALVMPSLSQEAFGLVACEALASGLPVILSCHALLADEVVGGGMGVALDPADPMQFAGILSRLDRDDSAIEAMSRRAYAAASRIAPTPQEWLQRLLDLYSELLARAEPFEMTHPPDVSSANQVTCHG